MDALNVWDLDMLPPAAKSRPLNALVIGAGPMAEAVHGPILAKLRDARALTLAVICDLDQRRAVTLQKSFGFAETSGDALAAIKRQDIDLVYIFASAPLHHDYGLAALEQGKHLFV